MSNRNTIIIVQENSPSFLFAPRCREKIRARTIEETSKLGENVHPPRSWKLISWRWGARWKARNSIFTKWLPKARSRSVLTNKSNRGKWNPMAPLFVPIPKFYLEEFRRNVHRREWFPRRKSEREITKGLGLKFPPVGKVKESNTIGDWRIGDANANKS